tara:strand:- start:85 stop:306 length:222 start_codon:yes stop_codon:yes gene_type:complete
MRTPNWQHHSKKEKKRTLKPQALRQARKKRGQLIKRLLTHPKGGFFSMIGTSQEKLHGSSARNQVTTSKTACY